MLNPVNCLNQLKTELSKNLNINSIIAFSNCPTPENFTKIALIEVKSIKQMAISFSIKILIHKNLGYDACLKFSSKLIKVLNQLREYSIAEFHAMPLNFNSNSKTFCQEIKLTLKEAEPKFDSSLKFNNDTIITQTATLKIERQTLNLGATIGNFNLIDFQKPVKKVVGCAQLEFNKFNKLLQALNSKTVAPLTFKQQTFNATLMELTLSWNDLVNFKFLETQNEL